MAWAEDRLRRLFERYHRQFWHGKLSAFKIVIGSCDGALGQCDSKKRVITINIQSHKSDRQVRSTLLHEMCHAASPKSQGHDVKFFAQLEKLLESGAPIGVEQPEAGRVKILQGVVPSRFPLLKRRMDRAGARRRKPIDALIQAKHLPVTEITDEYILHEFEELAWELTWKQALIFVGRENGLVDETGRPLNRRAAGVLKRAKNAYRRGRRRYLDDQYARKLLASAPSAPNDSSAEHSEE